MKTAGIIIIGNEILSGKVQDSNSFYLASELRHLGVNVMRISIIPDELDIIGSEVVIFSKTYDYVFTSGGVGPTHDDVTMEGIAKGFGVKLICHPELEKRFRLRFGNKVSDAIMKLALVPEEALLIDVGEQGFPIISFKNIIILPGIPEYLRKKFSAIKEMFRSQPFFLKRLFLNAEETEIAEALNKVITVNPDISFGSYPILGNPHYKVIVTAESKSETALRKSVDEFLSVIPLNIVFRVE